MLLTHTTCHISLNLYQHSTASCKGFIHDIVFISKKDCGCAHGFCAPFHHWITRAWAEPAGITFWSILSIHFEKVKWRERNKFQVHLVSPSLKLTLELRLSMFMSLIIHKYNSTSVAFAAGEYQDCFVSFMVASRLSLV